MNASSDERTVLALGALVRLLEYCGEARWLKWARGHLRSARAGVLDVTLLDAYGGFGSFNHLILDPASGHALEALEVPWANRLLATLGERVYQLALERTDERFAAEWVRPPDPPIQGWRCLECGHGEITDTDVEWWIARVLVPAYVADSSLAQDPELVMVVLSGQLIGAAESRADAISRAHASGIHYTFRDGEMRPCPSCESEETVDYRWIFAGGGLHPAEDNPELRPPVGRNGTSP
ncbi:MAG: hypothetical protein O2992_05110 [Gemmatimonadetes bacterium]|jgi:hypothetical protein|nr:hypothetical protein [Gemmatimonadota bacterium]